MQKILEKIDTFVLKYWWILICVISIPVIWALLVPGYYGASDDLHPAWLYEIDKVVRIGQIPPRFVPDLSYQFGYPLFNFVYPLPFYIAEIFHLLGFGFVDSIKLLFLITVPLSGIFMFLLVKKLANPTLALAAAVLYIYTPYRATDLYVRGAIGEIVSFVFFPILTLAVINLTSELKNKIFVAKWIGLGGLGLGMMILSHNIATYMIFPFLVLLGVLNIVILRKNWLQKSFIFLGMAVLGLFSSIYFWLPAILESRLMKYDTVFNFVDHFPTLKQLIVPFWGYGASVAGPYDGMSFFLGVSSLVTILLGCGIGILNWKKLTSESKILFVWIIFTMFSVIFMMNYRSSFLWENLPLIPYFQFPWRYLMVTTFVIPLLLYLFKDVKFNLFLAWGIIILTIFVNWSYFRPHDFLGRTDEYYLNKYIPYPDASEEYKLTQEEYLRLPKDTQMRPDKLYPLVEGSGVKKIEEMNPLSTKIKTESPVLFTLNYNKYNYPGWEAKIDGQPAQIVSGNPFGQITLQVPQGSKTVEVYFTETPFKILLDIISVIALAGSIFLVLSPRRLFQ